MGVRDKGRARKLCGNKRVRWGEMKCRRRKTFDDRPGKEPWRSINLGRCRAAGVRLGSVPASLRFGPATRRTITGPGAPAVRPEARCILMSSDASPYCWLNSVKRNDYKPGLGKLTKKSGTNLFEGAVARVGYWTLRHSQVNWPHPETLDTSQNFPPRVDLPPVP